LGATTFLTQLQRLTSNGTFTFFSFGAYSMMPSAQVNRSTSNYWSSNLCQQQASVEDLHACWCSWDQKSTCQQLLMSDDTRAGYA
jgi:hypothetical protein